VAISNTTRSSASHATPAGYNDRPDAIWNLSIGRQRDQRIHHTTANVTLIVNGDFAIAASPSSRTVNRGSSTTYTVTISAGPGFSGPVNLMVDGLPSRTTATFNPASLAGSGSSVLTVNVPKNG
jgi:hypothetical protein